MIGKCKKCKDHIFTFDIDEDGDYRIICYTCKTVCYDSHEGELKLAEVDYE